MTTQAWPNASAAGAATIPGQRAGLVQVAGSDADTVARGGKLLDQCRAHVAGTDDGDVHAIAPA